MSLLISISIFFKSINISTINNRYRYIEQGYVDVDGQVPLLDKGPAGAAGTVPALRSRKMSKKSVASGPTVPITLMPFSWKMAVILCLIFSRDRPLSLW